MIEIEEMREKFDNSPCAVFHGMNLVELSPGYAKVKLELKKEFLNWENMIHGGIIATLLDQAFGCACNTLEYIHVGLLGRLSMPNPGLYMPARGWGHRK